MLKIQDLKAAINGKEILKGLNLEVKPGEVHAIMGPNGSGKSTLMKIIAGIETADSGSVWIHKEIKTVMLQQDNDFDNEETLVKLGNFIVEVLELDEEKVFELQDWDLCCQ